MSDRAKLPIFDTIGAAFKYPLRHFLQVLKVGILPTLMIYGPIFLLAYWAFDIAWPEIVAAFEETVNLDENADIKGVYVSRGYSTDGGFSGLMQLAGLLFTAMVTVPLTRAIVLAEKPGFFRLDRAVWWYVLGQIVFLLAVVGIILAVAAATAGLIALASSGQENEATTVAIGIGGGLFATYLILRLSLFMPEVAVTGRFGFRASFSMTKGNVWRIVGLGLVTLLALIVLWTLICGVLLGVGALLFGGSIAQIASTAAESDPEIILALLETTLLSPAGGIMGALLVIVSVYSTGFSVALPAYMYKALESNRRAPS